MEEWAVIFVAEREKRGKSGYSVGPVRVIGSMTVA